MVSHGGNMESTSLNNLSHGEQRLRWELQDKNISISALTLQGFQSDFYFSEKGICLFVVNEALYNEHNVEKKFFEEIRKELSEKNIEPIFVYNSQLNNKFDIIFERLLYKLEHGTVKVDARNCEVRELAYKEYKDFLQKYHLMGSLPAKIRVGLYQGNELLCVTAFSKPRYNSKYDYEIGRYAVKFGYNVRGNFSKMLHYFVKTYNPGSILTYHDSLFGDNTVYEQAGFAKLEDSATGFYWYRDGQIYNRRKFWKNVLHKKLQNFDPGLSAHDNMRANGFVKIWDLGQGKYELILKNEQP